MKQLRLLYSLLRVLAPAPVARHLPAGSPRAVSGRVADPKAQAVADLVAQLRDPDALPSVAESRAQLAMFVRKFDRPGPRTVTRQALQLAGAAGPRAARLYTPRGRGEGAPTLLYFHGGGWIQGSLDTHDAVCAKLADRAGLRVISYDYRLAPEAPFPAAPDDILAAYLQLTDPAGPHRLDPARLAVGGDSAGGNLAASLLHSLSAAGAPLPAAQLLIYPGVDARLTSQSMADLRDDPLLSSTRIAWYLDHYLPPGQDRCAPRVSPLFSPHLAGQPPALVIAAGQDPLWDDGRSYAEALRTAGVDTDLLTYPGQLHGFLNLTRVIPEGEDAISRAADWLKERFGI
ncbi:alpha/beta hydrolase [Pseudodonghicola flavimaris]|uniref:Alpha/beta hydrolase n=1 Tax=Pseudodonghicola flavimaris TaxID=3050036 RepID=A0ABT7F5N2_9RHOB|nr:alpha/beta hydrolase [Pseudodonghicola flavimaris]MDK3019907.1 alpha/beta hydrolase [Pseudodonghicola flavimaris]